MAEVRFSRTAVADLIGCCGTRSLSRGFLREVGRSISTGDKVRRNCYESEVAGGYYGYDMDLPLCRLWILVRIRVDDGVDIVGIGRRAAL